MHKFTSLADIEREVLGRSDTTKRFSHTLDHMFELLEHLGNPQQRLRVIHVAGTSGKTSTAYYAAALLKEAGQQVGLTISPHIDSIAERVQIGLVPLSEAEFCERFSEFDRIVQKSGVVPNYFETFAVFALWEFAARRVDYAVVEVGIGGLLDSTNIFDDPSKVCVITDIGFDHTAILGDTLPEITAQKAGIIHLHNAVFCNRQSAEVMDAIHDHARRKQADLHVLKTPDLGEAYDFLPLFQRRNFGLALQAAKFVVERDELRPLGKGAVLRAAHIQIPGRMQVLRLDGKIVILDIAHNGQKLHTLLEAVREKFPKSSVAALIRLPIRDRSMRRAADGMREVIQGVDHIILTGLATGEAKDKSFQPEVLLEICRMAGFTSVEVVADPRQAFDVLCGRAEPVLLVAGSTYLLNYVRPLLRRQLAA